MCSFAKTGEDWCGPNSRMQLSVACNRQEIADPTYLCSFLISKFKGHLYSPGSKQTPNRGIVRVLLHLKEQKHPKTEGGDL